ncbi:unnamed protein product, partial [Brassica rapa]
SFFLDDLLENGTPRGKKDAATALSNLCIYQGNKGRAVRAGIVPALVKMLSDSSSHRMVDEALTILSVLASNLDAKAAIVKANTLPALIGILQTGQARNRENAAAVLLSLCKRDNEKLVAIGRLGAVVPLMDLTKNGTERGKRKAMSFAPSIFAAASSSSSQTVKKSSRQVIEKYYSRMTLDFHTNKKILEEVAIIPSKRLRNKIAGFSTHLMKRIQKGPVRGISLKLQEEERERRMDFVPDESAIKTDVIKVDKES